MLDKFNTKRMGIMKYRSLDGAKRNQGFRGNSSEENLDYASLHQGYDLKKFWWLWVDSNYRPQHYECRALTG